jgi:hypothetical protein
LTTLQASPLAIRIAERHNRKTRLRKADLERIHAEWEREKAERERVAPTPQRIAKRDIESRKHDDESEGRGLRYQPKQDILKLYKNKWVPEMEWAFYRLVDDAQATAVKNVTMNYDRAGVSSPATRMGGIGAAHAEQIEKFYRFNWVVDRLTGRSRKVCEFLLLGSKDGTIATATLEEVGHWLFPHFKDKNNLRMIALGRFLGAGDELIRLYTHFDMEHRFKEAYVRTREVNP